MNWVALPGSQQLFLSSPIFETLFEGTRGPGKTDSLLMDFAQHTGQGFGENWRGILFRQTYKQLSDVIAKSRRHFRRIFPHAKYNASNFSWVWPDGEELLLRHMKTEDDYWNYHGHEYPWIGWEELTNWPAPDCYESMKACSRSSMPGMPRKYRSTCNPFGVGHNWVKGYFIDPAPRGNVIRDGTLPRVAIHGSLYENIVLLKNDPEYVQKLESIKSEAKRRAWLYGDWDIVAGGMFDDVWDPDVHLLEPFEIPQDWDLSRAFDWGSSRPFSLGWWARATGTPAVYRGQRRHFAPGSLIRVGEWYGWSGEANVGINMHSADIAKKGLEMERRLFEDRYVAPGAADASIYDVRDGRSIAMEMEAHGMYFVPSQKGPGSRINGWDHLRRMLASCEANEDPGLYAFNTCRQFARCFPSLPRDAKDMDDVDTEAEDHIGDETRYEATRHNSGLVVRDMYPSTSKRKH